jgi:hypothetical protein
MKITALNAEQASGKTNGSSLKGYIACKYADLISLLGQPAYGQSGDEKVNFDWVVEFGGNYFTIYDWKTYNVRYSTESLNQWNVGGKVSAVDFIEYIEKQIKNK